MSVPAPLSVAVWGLGRHAIGKVLPAVNSASGLNLYGVCSRNESSVAASAGGFGCKGWSDPAAMLADPEVDVVYVSTPIGLHGEHGRRALEAGKHLLCEKPFAATLGDTGELLELARSRSLCVCEGYMYLHHAQFQQLREILAEDRIGKILTLDCRFGIPALEHPGFREDPSLGGGALLDVGCYPISALEALMPESEKRVVLSRMSTRAGSPVDTSGHAVIEMSGGAVARLEWRTGAAYRNDLGVWGESGTLYTDRIFSKAPDYIPSFLVRDVTGRETLMYGQADDHFIAMLETFRQMIDDRGAADAERKRILGRAVLLDQISRMAER